MNTQPFSAALEELPLGPLRYFNQIDSTNSEAARWADADAPDLALVVADEQTAGRGRMGRRWFTPPGAALAFSLVLRTDSWANLPGLSEDFPQLAARLTALGALAVSQALHDQYGLQAQIKWPNDVLLAGRKTAGILVEAHWHGDQLTAVILGIGINVSPQAVPPENELVFPATCIQAALGQALDRAQLLHAVLGQLLAWRHKLADTGFLSAWEQRLAFRGEWVYIFGGVELDRSSARYGRLLGLDAHGQLFLQDPGGQTFAIQNGEIRLRPVTA